MRVKVEAVNLETLAVESAQVVHVQIGAQGPAGPPGPAGAGFEPRGAWDADTEYVENDLVTHDGSAFYTLAGSQGDEPPSAPWVLLVSKGEKGDAGPAGADSTVPGPPGSAATVAVGTVSTGSPGSDAEVENSGSSSAAVLDFTIPRGDKGEQGEPGTPGSPGSPGAPGADGREVELQATETHVQWRYEGDVGWSNLVALSELKGDDGDPGSPGSPGADGEEVSLQVTDTHIQWRLGSGDWSNLIALSELVGPAGSSGSNGADGTPQWQGPWSAGTYAAGEAVSHGGSSFVANTTTTQEPPHSDWDVLAAKGDSGGGAFTDLSDAPSSYSGQGGKVVAVNSGATALEFVDAPSGGGGLAVRHDSAPPFDYTGSAPIGSGEGDSVWTVTRLTLASPPVVETGEGSWTGRAGISYS